MKQGKDVRARIPEAIYKAMLQSATIAGVPIKFWLYEAIKEKAQRQEDSLKGEEVNERC